MEEAKEILKMNPNEKHFLFWCAAEHQSFRIPEFEALFSLFKIHYTWVEKNHQEPWVIVKFGSEKDVQKILSRSISTKYCVELWGDGISYENLISNVKKCPDVMLNPFCSKDVSFKVCVDAFMKKLTMKDKVERIEMFSFLPLEGPVNLKNPDVTLSLFEFYGLDQNPTSKSPTRLFFGRCLGEGQRDLIMKLSLKDRCFIANTSMDPTLSLLMANLACISKSSLAIDPFVGSGSLLVAAAQFGAKVVGSDIDYLLIHGKSRSSRVGQTKRKKGEHIRGNFSQYGIGNNFVDVIVVDNASPPWRNSAPIFDAVITDPPYGIREPTEKVGTRRVNPEIPKEYLETHYPQKIEYNQSDIYTDLLTFGVNSLSIGGRLVCWIPVNRQTYAESNLPKHSNLNLVANCEQRSSEPASFLRALPEWYSRVPTLESLAAIIVSQRIASNLSKSNPRQVWKSPHWRKKKKDLKFLPPDIREFLITTTWTFLKKTRDNGWSLFTCWWIFFDDKCDKYIDQKHYDFFDGNFLIELVDYLGSVRTKVTSACISYNWILHSSFQRMIQKQPQLKNITLSRTIRPEALRMINEGLELESVTFYCCLTYFKDKDLMSLLLGQQKTLKAFRWDCLTADRFPESVDPQLLLNNLQVLTISGHDFCKLPKAAFKTIVKLEVNVTTPLSMPETDKRMKSLKELKIIFSQSDSTVDLGFCSIFENQSDVGPLNVEIVSSNLTMPGFVLSQIPNIQSASVYISSENQHVVLIPLMPSLKELKGHCTIGLFKSFKNCPNVEWLELKVQGSLCPKLCKEELTKIKSYDQKLNLQRVDIICDDSAPDLLYDDMFEIFVHFEMCCPCLSIMTIQQTVEPEYFNVEAADDLIRRLASRGFMLEVSRLSMPIVEVPNLSTIVYRLPVRYTISCLR